MIRGYIIFGCIDIQVECSALSYDDLSKAPTGESSSAIRERVIKAPNNFVVIQNGDNRIGKTYWIFKNSYGTNRYYEHKGYAYVLFNDQSYFNTPYYAKSPLSSQLYSDADIAVTDNDGDGYYSWGIGSKPSHSPNWIPNQQDGDDNDYAIGPIDDFGNAYNLATHVNDTVIVSTNTTWTIKRYIYNNIIVPSGVTLTIQDDVIDRKVYFIPKNMESCYVLFDFDNANGDIISVTDAIHRDWERDLKIVEERIMNIKGESRRCILMQPIWEDNPIQTLSGWWIESVCSELGPLNTWLFGAVGNNSYFQKCAIYEKVIFDMEDFKGLSSGILPVHHIEKDCPSNIFSISGVKIKNKSGIYIQDKKKYLNNGNNR